MKVLHVIRGLANSSGTTHIVGPLAEEQARRGCEVSVYCVAKGREAPALPNPELVDSRCFRCTLPLDNPGLSLGIAKALGRNVRGFNVVHVHAVWNFPSWWAMRCAYRREVPYMVAPQGSFDPWALRQSRTGKRWYGALTEVPYIRRATRMQALTLKEAGQIRTFGIDVPSEIIPNGVDRPILDRPPRPDPGYFGLPADCRTLLFLSRVHPKKGLDMLVDAAPLIHQRIPDLRIVIAGSDAGSGYFQSIRARCKNSPAGDIFVLLGEVRGSDKFDVLAAAHGFVLPSRSEGLPVAVIEAMGSGLPVVVTDECNVPEVSERDAGLVVRPDVKEIGEAVTDLFSMPETRRRAMGENARKLVGEKFTWDRIAQQTLSCYEAMMKEAGRR